ncbi:MAG: amidohydrolase family protein [Fimbriimonadaceae bacterium]|nr:amidohydrolase family protein [Fimbriimonadaceae bacterium]
MKKTLLTALVLAALSALASAYSFPFELEADRKPRTLTQGNCLIKNATVLTGVRGTLSNTDVLIRNGKIEAIGKGLRSEPGLPVIDATGKFLMAGIVDGHSHRASDGTNEGSESLTCEVRIQDVLNPTALNIWQALASGHTSALILHGSANSVGGESVVVKYKYQTTAKQMIVPDAPLQVKFALGENVTRKGDTTGSRFPRSRMGVEALYRRAFQEAREYEKSWADFRKGAMVNGKKAHQPRKDLRLETFDGILNKKVWVQCHSYRSDEILMLARLSEEYGFKIGSMQHALEAYKIAPELAKLGVPVSIFVDSWSFKVEGYDAIPWNAAICTRAGVIVSINTDGLSGTTALNIDAAKTMRFGGMTEEEAVRTVTLNGAIQLGIDHRTGSIEVGKDADLALWDGHPLSVYSVCALTMVEGVVYFERRDAFGIDRVATRKSELDRPSRAPEPTSIPTGKPIAIVGATLHPVSSRPIAAGTMVVQGERIIAIGKDVAIPRGARVVNGRGLNIYPGFIDGFSTMGLAEISPVPVMMDNSELGPSNPDLDAATALWVESAHYGPALYNGITHAFVGPTSGVISGQGALIKTAGLTPEQLTEKRKAALLVGFATARRGPTLDVCDDCFDASLALGLGGAVANKHDHDHDDEKEDAKAKDEEGHHHHGRPEFIGDDHLSLLQREAYFDLLGGRQEIQPEQAQSTVNASIDGIFDSAIAYAKLREQNPAAPKNVRLEAMLPYVRGERPLVLTTRTAASIRSAVAFAEKYKLKVILRGASEAWREAPLLRQAGIPVILTPAGKSTLSANLTDQPYDPYDTPYVQAGILQRAGVKFCFGSGSPSEVMNLAVRTGQHCAYGLSPEAALRSLTLSAAEIFGVEKDLGSLQVGKKASFIVTDGDPFELTTRMHYVFIDGISRPLQSKHTMLRDRYQGR